MPHGMPFPRHDWFRHAAVCELAERVVPPATAVVGALSCDATHGHTSLAHAEYPERFLSHPALVERMRHDVGASAQATLVDLLSEIHVTAIVGYGN
jgi:hypothetical protein